MGQKWIIDVIADLREFADQNGLPLLAHQLEATSTVAQAEIALMLEGAPSAANINARQSASPSGNTRTRHGA